MRTLLKLVLMPLAWMGARAYDILTRMEKAEATANALKPGTIFTMERCKCPYDHRGLWRIEEYMVSAGDYRISRPADGEQDYARREVMQLVTPAVTEQ